MAITKKDIEKLSDVFATKKDIEKLSDVFATKKDIEKLSDVFATKEDLKAFATKDDLSKLRNEMLTGQDKIIKKLEDMSIEQKMAYAQYKRHDEKIENHEVRIKTLETKVPA
ncbi:hypothetical protein HZC34_03510 [Candidatus Saganbacteria bacterium]|nr:hypothetical protein [Candidatus Saganbacteria bacterium]